MGDTKWLCTAYCVSVVGSTRHSMYITCACRYSNETNFLCIVWNVLRLYLGIWCICISVFYYVCVSSLCTQWLLCMTVVQWQPSCIPVVRVEKEGGGEKAEEELKSGDICKAEWKESKINKRNKEKGRLWLFKVDKRWNWLTKGKNLIRAELSSAGRIEREGGRTDDEQLLFHHLTGTQDVFFSFQLYPSFFHSLIPGHIVDTVECGHTGTDTQEQAL